MSRSRAHALACFIYALYRTYGNLRQKPDLEICYPEYRFGVELTDKTLFPQISNVYEFVTRVLLQANEDTKRKHTLQVIPRKYFGGQLMWVLVFIPNQIYKMDDPTEFSVCPFNSSHRILTFRMPGHVLRCRRNYNGPPLETCIYNACHLVPVGTMKAHLETCRERHLFHICDYEKGFRKEIS